MEKRRRMIGRVLIAVVMGLVIFAVTLITAWRQYGASMYFHVGWLNTYVSLGELGLAVRDYPKTYGRLPASLKDLRGLAGDVHFEENGEVLDGWGKPFGYAIEGNEFKIFVVGPDGKSRGNGWHHDFHEFMQDYPNSLPTLREFLFDLPTEGMVYTCLFCGVLVGLLTFWLVRLPRLSVGVVADIAAASVGALIVTWILAALHIPTGH